MAAVEHVFDKCRLCCVELLLVGVHAAIIFITVRFLGHERAVTAACVVREQLEPTFDLLCEVCAAGVFHGLIQLRSNSLMSTSSWPSILHITLNSSDNSLRIAPLSLFFLDGSQRIAHAPSQADTHAHRPQWC